MRALLLLTAFVGANALLDDLKKSFDSVIEDVGDVADNVIDEGKKAAAKVGENAHRVWEALNESPDGEKKQLSENCVILCPRVFDPVCGSDGQSYAHECLLRTAACEQHKEITVAHEGLCADKVEKEIVKTQVTQAKDACDEACTREFRPVCGTNGQTYPNACVLRVAACKDSTIALKSEGPCEATNCDIMCPALWAPVCGSNNITYSNACDLRRAACQDPNLKVLHKGECMVLSAETAPQTRVTGFVVGLSLILSGFGLVAVGLAMFFITRSRVVPPPLYSEFVGSTDSIDVSDSGPVPYEEKLQHADEYAPLNSTKHE